MKTLDQVARAVHEKPWVDLTRAQRHAVLISARTNRGHDLWEDGAVIRTDLSEDELLESVRVTIDPDWKLSDVTPVVGQYFTNGVWCFVDRETSKQAQKRHASLITKAEHNARAGRRKPRVSDVRGALPDIRDYGVLEYVGYGKAAMSDTVHIVYKCPDRRMVAFNASIMAAMRRLLPKDSAFMGGGPKDAGAFVQGRKLLAVLMPMNMTRVEVK